MYGMVEYGMVWYGMVRYGMVWLGMVWYGIVWLTMSGRGGNLQMRGLVVFAGMRPGGPVRIGRLCQQI